MTSMQNSRRVRSFAGSLVVMTVLLTASAAMAQNDVCIPVTATPPTLDGTVEGDPGWEGAARIDLDCPGISPSTYVRLCRVTTPSNALYIGLMADTPGIAPNLLDRIVLGFVPDAVDTHAWRIHITPFPGAIFMGPSTAAAVSYWHNYSSWNSGSSGTTPGGLGAPSAWLQAANIKMNNFNNSRWGLEMMIPISDAAAAGADSGVYLPTAGTFRLYINMVKTAPGGFACQYPWPSSSSLGASLNTGTPAKTSWGVASLTQRVNCNVLLTWDKIGIISPPADTDQTLRCYAPDGGFTDCSGLPDTAYWPDLAGSPNTFFAKPRNRLPTMASVGARFKTAPWGSPGPDDWTLVQYPDGLAPLVNPTDPAATLLPGTQANLCLDWSLTYKQSCQNHDDPFKSILVELVTSDPEHTTFAAPSVQRTMDTVPLSSVSRVARVGTKGYPAPSSGIDRMVLTVGKQVLPRPSKVQPAPRSAAAPAPAAAPALAAAARIPARISDAELYPTPQQVGAARFSSGVTEIMTWVCRCFRKTGGSLTIDDIPSPVTFEDARVAGGFGFIAGHDGEVESWKANLTGQGLKRIHDGLFELEIPHGSSGLVTTHLEAEEFRRWGAALRIGYAGPLGTFGRAVDGGWSETVEIEHRLDSMFALDAQFGMNEFRRGQAGTDVTVFQNSADLKAYFLDGDLRPWAEAGLGFYGVSPGRDAFGLNFGLGIRYRLSDLVGLEAAWQYHEVLSPGPNPRYSTLQVGLSLRF
jgi:hypothetical protein